MPAEILTLPDRFVGAVRKFKPFHDGKDKIWRFFLKTGRNWFALHIVFYDSIYYCSGGNVSCEIGGNKPVLPENERYLATWLSALSGWHEEVSRAPLAAQQRILRNLPLEHRLGLILRSNIRRLLHDWCDFSAGLKDVPWSELESLLERHPSEPLADMTLGRYLEYCRIAYEANPDTFEHPVFVSGRSGIEYYREYADGRHGGLLDIDSESAEAFSSWYHSAQHQGAHPWEIYRGGNSTHISLSVAKDQYRRGWRVALAAFSSTRLVEACRIALALDRAGLPVEILDRESYLLRLRNEDWVGILPEGSSLRYAWHNFPSDYKVSDSMHLSWFLEEKSPREKAALRRRLHDLVQWMPLRFSWEPAED